MDNKSIAKLFKLTASLMEIHAENEFKTKGLYGAAYKIENLDSPLSALLPEELSKVDGVGKSSAQKIQDILATGTFEQLEELKERTPAGVFEMMDLPGFGPKKVGVLWRELKVDTIIDLLAACDDGRVAALKGFGEKSQQAIKDAIAYKEANKGRLRYATAEVMSDIFVEDLKKAFSAESISYSGDMRRKMEIIDRIELLMTGSQEKIVTFLQDYNGITLASERSGPLTIRGYFDATNTQLVIRVVSKEKFHQKLIYYTGSMLHLNEVLDDGETILRKLKSFDKIDTEKHFYESIGLAYIEPEIREGQFEILLAKESKLPNLVEYEDIKGILHNHSTYSDGKNSLREMAVYCKELGYEYLGISDHSKTAFYAGGLKEEEIIRQHKEIDELNSELAPFKVFKGIESDILNDGSLDYDDTILASFDFIVASIHSNYSMDIEKATSRLIKAVENKYTTILGHPTARLILEREGYPVDHKRLIDACAENNVVIEINASPYRLDLDWRWVHYAMEKGVMLSINPDAHEVEGYHNMRYGWLVGRKGGLTKEMTMNCMSLKEIEKYIMSKKGSAPILK